MRCCSSSVFIHTNKKVVPFCEGWKRTTALAGHRASRILQTGTISFIQAIICVLPHTCLHKKNRKMCIAYSKLTCIYRKYILHQFNLISRKVVFFHITFAREWNHHFGMLWKNPTRDWSWELAQAINSICITPACNYVWLHCPCQINK